MKKKLSKADLVPAIAGSNEKKPIQDTLFPMSLMECPRCRIKLAGFKLGERAECGECGQGYLVLKARRIVFGLS